MIEKLVDARKSVKRNKYSLNKHRKELEKVIRKGTVVRNKFDKVGN